MDSVANSTQNIVNIELTEFWQTNAAFIIGVYGMLALLPIGVAANTLAYVVFGRLQPQSTTTLYLQALAIADLVALTWDITISTALPLIGVKFVSWSTWTCKLGIWFDMSSSVVSSCALMLVAVDRLTILYKPTFHAAYCSRNFAVVVSVGLWIFTFAYCLPLVYFYELDSQARCALPTQNMQKLEIGLAFVTFITYGPYFAMPAVIIIFVNVIIIRKIWRRKTKRRRMGKPGAESDDVSKILITDCLSFLILIGITATLWALCWTPAENDEQRAHYGLLYVLAQFISCCEESIDLFLYLACSKNFRRTFLAVVKFRLEDSPSRTYTNVEYRIATIKPIPYF